jgi:hypothetical protein
MKTLGIDKVCIILGHQDESRLKELNGFLRRVFPYLNITCNIYIVATGLSEGMPEVERIQEGMKAYLRENLFVHYYLHFLHPVPQGGTGEIGYYEQYYYHPWRRGSFEFDREGYMHEEIPRLMLIPVLIPGEDDDEAFIAGLLDRLEERFSLLSLCLCEGTFALAQNADLIDKADKVYYGPNPSNTLSEIACNLFAQDLLETSCVALQSGTLAMRSPCASSLFITADDGLVFPCIEAFKKGEPLTGAYEERDLKSFVKRCEDIREAECDCGACRAQVIREFSKLPLPVSFQSEVAALLEHLQVDK